MIATLTWHPTEHYYAFTSDGDLGILFCVEPTIGSKLYTAIVLEGYAGTPLRRFISHSTFQAVLGEKFRSSRAAQAACIKYLRQVQRQRKHWRPGNIEVIEAPSESERAFLLTWAQASEPPQA